MIKVIITTLLLLLLLLILMFLLLFYYCYISIIILLLLFIRGSLSIRSILWSIRIHKGGMWVIPCDRKIRTVVISYISLLNVIIIVIIIVITLFNKFVSYIAYYFFTENLVFFFNITDEILEKCFFQIEYIHSLSEVNYNTFVTSNYFLI